MVKQYQAESASAVVLDVSTGEIIAMANYPSFNPNVKYYGDLENRRNKAVTDLYEPGSTFKALTLAYLVDKGGIDAKSTVDLGNGLLKLDGNIVKDVVKQKGKVSIENVVRKSSNVGFAKLVLEHKFKDFNDYLFQLGVGDSSYSGFIGEPSSHVNELIRDNSFSYATLSFGYGVSMTPLQLARAYGIMANGGRAFTPKFLKVADDFSLSENPPIFDENRLNDTKSLLNKVVNLGGSGHRARVKGYEVCGKTGTTKISGGKDGYKKDYVASFAGFAPLKNPKRVVVVVVRKPEKAYYGSVVAAPVFSKIMLASLRQLRKYNVENRYLF